MVEISTLKGDSGNLNGVLLDSPTTTNDALTMHQFAFSYEGADNQSLLMEVLPYYPDDIGEDPVLDFTEYGLLLDGHRSFKYPADNIVDVFAIRLVTSNAKQLSKFFQLCLGMKEIAYKGLETGSKLIGAHVLRNGDITIELVNGLISVKEGLKEDQPDLDLSQLSESQIQFLKSTIMDYCNSKIIDGSSKIFSIHKSHYGHRSEVPVTTFFNKYVRSLLDVTDYTVANTKEATLIQNFLGKHSDGVFDISLRVKDISACFARAIVAGAKCVRPPSVISDQFGSVKIASIGVPNTDLVHTLIENIDYRGTYLPNYKYSWSDPSSLGFYLIAHAGKLPSVPLSKIDHCVENYSWNQTLDQAKFYARAFGFHKFWAVDEKDVSTVNSSLISIVMASANGNVKLPLNEPAKGKMRGQIEEFYDYNEGAGIQHIAFRTSDIIGTVKALKARGLEFNNMDKSYYDNLKKRMINDRVRIREDLNELMKLNILLDYEKTKKGVCNYILQIFTKPLHDRPTLFLEIIQRYHHDGFGKGTFKGLYESIEAQQILRGTLVPRDGLEE